MRSLIDWGEDWDEAVGLWWQSEPGHTAQTGKLETVRPGPNASSRLLLAAQLDQLDQVRPAKILAALRAMQTVDGGKLHGCLKWYWEEGGPVDTNAAFFTALGLIPLRVCHADRLGDQSQRLLDEILADLRVWFANQAEHRAFFYPNKFLGDLVCAWLLDELAGEPSPVLAAIMREAADYWLNDHWGWGEHMSDGYSLVCLDELSLLLLMARKLPDDLRATYQRLLANLLEIDDAFAEGPRVPAIRTYDFLKSPAHTAYRGRISPFPSSMSISNIKNMPMLGPLFHEMGWEMIVQPASGPKAGAYSIPCHGGADAHAWIAADFRCGGMSRYPIMPNTDHSAWGLSWQTMPAAFWSRQGDWGYWQWEADEAGVVRSHPSPDMRTGKALSSAASASAVGKTFSLMRGGNMLMLRVMPVMPTSWNRLTDRLRIVNLQAGIERREPVNGWSQLVMRLPGRVIAAQCLPLTCRAAGKNLAADLVEKSNPAKLLDWELNLFKSDLNGLEMAVTLWGLSIDGEVIDTPLLAPSKKVAALPRLLEHSAWELIWRWPGVEWNVIIDPLDSQEPLRSPS